MCPREYSTYSNFQHTQLHAAARDVGVDDGQGEKKENAIKFVINVQTKII